MRKRRLANRVLFVVAGLSAITTSQAAPPAFIPPKYQGIILYAPVPEYPEGTRYYAGESGIYRLNINQQTGSVTEVSVMKRAHEAKLNAAAIFELFKWKFKPGTVKQLDVPFEYERGYMRPELKNAAAR